MKITFIQTALHWEDRTKNLEHFEKLFSKINNDQDLIVLPEMFATGFTMNPKKNAEPANGESLAWMKKKAIEKNAVVTGSLSVSENGKFYNRLFWVDPSGIVQEYDKRHLFRMAKEDEHYTAGEKKLITKIANWKICPLICYDLRFPVWSRNVFTPDNSLKAKGTWDYDVLIYVANWPQVRSHPWKSLLIARAIENQCYVIGVNRVGKDGNDFDHSGDSVVIDPKGEIISATKAFAESVESLELSRTYLDEFRAVFPVGLDADRFTI